MPLELVHISVYEKAALVLYSVTKISISSTVVMAPLISPNQVPLSSAIPVTHLQEGGLHVTTVDRLLS